MDMSSEIVTTDAVIVGAGPCGLFAVFELGLLDIRCEVVDILDRPGGQCAELYPEKPIYDIPALPYVTGQELVDRLLQQIKPFKAGFHFSQMVTELRKTPAGDFELKTDGGATVEANAERLIQVFENILDNAVSFSAPGATIAIETESRDGVVITHIADQGPGIPAAHMEKIFDRFFTYREGTDKRRTGHTGLGLAIVRAIVEGYGGSITAANRPEGGAVFEIRLPSGTKRN